MQTIFEGFFGLKGEAIQMFTFGFLSAVFAYFLSKILLAMMGHGTNKEIHDKLDILLGRSPVSIIHLGMKDAQINSEVEPVSITIRPDDFQIKADRLRAKLLHGFQVKDHPDTETLAWCILEHAGLGAYVENKSRTEIQKALTRLLLNGEAKAITSFLSTLADSIALQSVVTNEPAPTN